jgi:hypothetical protein
MTGPRIEGLDEAHKRHAQQLTHRFHALDKVARYVAGTQYEGRPHFLYPGVDVPLHERAPCIVAPVVATAIAQHVDFALGEGRFPKLTTGASEDESDLGGSGLTERQSKTLDQFLAVLVEHARLQDVSQDALGSAEECGTACVVVGARNGCLEVESLDAKEATPTFGPDGRTLLSIEHRRPYIEISKGQDGVLRAKCLVYRRVVDEQADTVYLPAEAPPEGREPKWSVDKARTAEHGLGFVPAVWWRFRLGSRRIDSLDGEAIHKALFDEIDALNMSLSQRHRAALYAGDPQLWETGVDENEQVAPMGEEPRAGIVAGHHIVDGKPVSFSKFGFNERPRGGARRKGAGTVWRYQSAESQVGMLTLPGDALKSLDEHCSDVESKIHQALAYTAADPENVRGAMSGKALAFLFARTTMFVDRARRDLWDGFLSPLLSVALRLVHTLETRAPGSLYLTGTKKALPILARFMREQEAGAQWMPPRIKPIWGDYFTASAEDEKAVVETCKAAFEAKLVTREIACEKLRGIFTFESATEIAEQLDEEAEEAAAAELEVAEAAAPEPAEDATKAKPEAAK